MLLWTDFVPNADAKESTDPVGLARLCPGTLDPVGLLQILVSPCRWISTSDLIRAALACCFDRSGPRTSMVQFIFSFSLWPCLVFFEAGLQNHISRPSILNF